MASWTMQDKRSPRELLIDLWRDERPAFPLWAPVFVGLGVQIYFWLPAEPSGWLFSGLFAAPVILWAGFWKRLQGHWLFALAVVLIALGFALGGARARLVEAPVLSASIDATIEGTIRSVGQTSSGRPRLVLDELVIFGREAETTPERAQIALQKQADLGDLTAGERISIFAQVGPPGGPVEPGGFDYRRTAWFLSLGAVGYAHGPPVRIDDGAAPGLMRRLSIGLARVRSDIAAGLRARLPGETGAFAAAVTVGERSGITRESVEALRESNLAHLLAISGLHMGIVTALVFGAARLILAAIPFTGRRWRTKRIAAGIALIAAVGYLCLSGASIATQRAFVMAAVALVAVIANRPAITLRALAVAALIILVLRPESLTHVGFQMSFAATAAIIAGFDYSRARGWSGRVTEGGLGARFAGYVLALAATSLLAGLATAPFAAFHFNRVAHYGLIANLAAVPTMGMWVAPSALIAAALAPFGADGIALAVMGRGIEAILWVARGVASLPGATSPVAAGPPIVLTLITFGGLALCLGRDKLKAAGLVVAVLGFVVWGAATTRPDVLIAPNARLIGVDGPQGRSLDHAKTQSYAARIWLQRDGDGAEQAVAAERGGFTKGRGVSETTLANGWRIVVLRSRRLKAEDIEAACAPRTLVLAPRAPRGGAPASSGACLILTGETLRGVGALALDLDGDGRRITTAATRAGSRVWTGSSGATVPVAIAGAE
ncbi:MAG: ComEC/Rec2 family competence protein [Pseudomonadota bacterium]